MSTTTLRNNSVTTKIVPVVEMTIMIMLAFVNVELECITGLSFYDMFSKAADFDQSIIIDQFRAHAENTVDIASECERNIRVPQDILNSSARVLNNSVASFLNELDDRAHWQASS